MPKKEIEQILSKLPETTNKKLFMYDQAVNTFVLLILQGQDVYTVMDQMFVYYTQVLTAYQDQIIHMEQRLTPDDMLRLGRYDEIIERLQRERKSQENIRIQIAKEETNP